MADRKTKVAIARVRKYRHRPDDEDHAHIVGPGNGGPGGVDPQSDGLARAKRLGVAATAEGIDGLVRMPVWKDIGIVFDATSAAAHKRHSEICLADNKVMIDLTPAAIGPYVIPEVNGDAHLDALNVNMVTCGGQATIPIVAAVSQVATVHYGEIVSSIASRSAGPGTRANIDEFTQTTALGIEKVGGAAKERPSSFSTRRSLRS